jgi:antitoxin ParD1/3/4
VVVSHVGSVHRAQRHSHRVRDRRLRHSALTQQHHREWRVSNTPEGDRNRMTEDLQNDWRTADERAQDVAQARALKEQASKGGLRFETYLPSGLAAWVLDLVERGVFVDPSEAVFVMLGEHRDLEPHADLRRESLKRSLDAAVNDPRPTLSLEEVRERMKKLFDEPRPEPAVWQRRSSADTALPSLVAIEAQCGQ